MQRLLEIPQEVYGFLRNFRLRAGDWNREGGSKTAPFTHPLPGVPTPLVKILILQQAHFWSILCFDRYYDSCSSFRPSSRVSANNSPAPGRNQQLSVL